MTGVPWSEVKLKRRIQDLEKRVEELEGKLKFLAQRAEQAEEDLDTGADYYHETVIPVKHLKRWKLI